MAELFVLKPGVNEWSTCRWWEQWKW